MTGFGPWFRKELWQIARTWRIWVLPGLLIVFALTSPVLAQVTPELVRSLASDDPGVIIELPEPVPADAFRQWGQALTQIVLIALVVTTAGMVSGERRSGTVALVLPKPLTRRAFVLGKAAAQAALLVLATSLATAVCAGTTWLLFGQARWIDLVKATGVWLALALALVGLMTLLSTALPAQAGAAGVGIAVVFGLTVLALWEPVRTRTPAGLLSAVETFAAGGSAPVLWPLLSAAIVLAVTLAAAVALFQRQSQTNPGGG